MRPMRFRTGLILVGLLAVAPLSGRVMAQEKKDAPPPPPPLALKIGDEAPDFTLTDDTGAKVTLSSFRGQKSVALAFYVFAFTGG